MKQETKKGFSMSKKSVENLRLRNRQGNSGTISVILTHILSLSDSDRLKGVSPTELSKALGIDAKAVRTNFRKKLNLGTTDRYDVININVEHNNNKYACLLNKTDSIRYYLVKDEKELKTLENSLGLTS
jgi:uncharacterized protein involved in exopolysaccharide biosynthesis